MYPFKYSKRVKKRAQSVNLVAKINWEKTAGDILMNRLVRASL